MERVSPPLTPETPARGKVIARDGRATVLLEGQPLHVGRDTTCDLSFPNEARLSRRAAHLSWNGFGVVIANVSRTHGLTVATPGCTIRLASRSDTSPATGFFLAGGTATVTGPSWPETTFEFTVELGADAPRHAGSTNLALSATREPLRLKPFTKEFITALLLCRPRLLDPSGTTPPPPVPHLTHQILEVTNSWHLLREIETDENARRRLTGRVQEHIKGLKSKITRNGVVPQDTRITHSVLVEILVATEAITIKHLDRLEDPSWLEWQESNWWHV